MVEGVIFDAFGTLVEIQNRQNPYRRLLRIGAHQGRVTHPSDIRWVMTHGHGHRLEDTAAVLGIKLSSAQLTELQDALELELKSVRLFNDALPAIELLRARGIKIGVCSNLSSPYCLVVRRLLPGLDAYALSSELSLMKPDPEIYQAICRMLNISASHLSRGGAERVMMIGDSKKCDQDGPRQVGIMGYHLDRSRGGRFGDLLEFARFVTDPVLEGI